MATLAMTIGAIHDDAVRARLSSERSLEMANALRSDLEALRDALEAQDGEPLIDAARRVVTRAKLSPAPVRRLADVKKDAIERALAKWGTLYEAALSLDITRASLKRRIIKHNIDWPPRRSRAEVF